MKSLVGGKEHVLFLEGYVISRCWCAVWRVFTFQLWTCVSVSHRIRGPNTASRFTHTAVRRFATIVVPCYTASSTRAWNAKVTQPSNQARWLPAQWQHQTGTCVARADVFLLLTLIQLHILLVSVCQARFEHKKLASVSFALPVILYLCSHVTFLGRRNEFSWNSIM